MDTILCMALSAVTKDDNNDDVDDDEIDFDDDAQWAPRWGVKVLG